MSKLNPKDAVHAAPNGDMDRYTDIDWSQVVIPDHIVDQSVEVRFREKLKQAGVDRITREIMICKFVYEYSFRQIQEELHLTSAMQAFRMLTKGLEFLRSKGFAQDEDDTLT